MGSYSIDRELPTVARAWGRVLDTSELLPGDLVLTRSVLPDRVSQAITKAQRDGGFATNAAQWTHAAVYLGNGEHICEANFKEQNLKWGVNIRSIFEYCDGKTALRIRRPSNFTDQQRIGVAIGAMASIGKGYSFQEALAFWRAAATGRGFWQGNVRQRIRTQALVCSTLYQDAYNFAHTGMSIRMGSLCTPAHLSVSPDFDIPDPPIGWLLL